MNNAPRLLGTVLLLTVTGLLAYAGLRSGPPEPVAPPELHTKTILYRFTLRNPTARPVSGARFLTRGPVRRTAGQTCTHIDASSPFDLTRDDLGNQTLHFDDLTFAPFQSRTITIRAQLELAVQPLPAEAPDSRFLAAAPRVPADHPRIRTIARTLATDDPNHTARNIHNWVAGHLNADSYRKEARGALWALTHRKGDCTEHMDLFAALGRAGRLPVRRMAGYLHRNGVQLRPGDFHNWCEFYSDHTWRLADPQQNTFDTRYPGYVALQIIDTPAQPPGAASFNRFSITPDVLTVRMEG